MRTPIITLTLLLLCQIGWACGSYEECIELDSMTWKDGQEFDTDRMLLKAIAYKLDEIEKKLNPPNPMTMMIDKAIKKEDR